MPLYYPTAPCAVCGQSIGDDESNILGFDFIDIPERDFQFGDCLAHVSCLSSWERRDEFITAWNRALREYYIGKQLLIADNGRVTYTDYATWRIQWSPTVKRRNAEDRAQRQRMHHRRRADLAGRMDAARQMAIRLGIANADDVDGVICNLPVDEFQRHFSEFNISRAFFKNAHRRTLIGMLSVSWKRFWSRFRNA